MFDSFKQDKQMMKTDMIWLFDWVIWDSFQLKNTIAFGHLLSYCFTLTDKLQLADEFS